MELKEIIRRRKSGQSISKISKATGRDRKTIRKYLNLIEEEGLIDLDEQGKDDTVKLNEALQKIKKQTKRKPGKQNIFTPYYVEIKKLIEKKGKNKGLKIKSAYKVICLKHDLSSKTSFSSFKRYISSQNISAQNSQTTCRIETPPGNQLQVDYAKVGLLLNPGTGKRKTVYAFIGTLSYSRHKYVEFVYSQDQKSFVESHVRMFKFFGGVPKTIVIDNLKSGVIKPDLYNPLLNRSYSEMAEYYNCFIDTARVATPKDKPKVERDVQTIREEFKVMLAINKNLTITEANKGILEFLVKDYGRRKHGTTGEEPLKLFEEVEKKSLLELPFEEFEVSGWKEAKVHPDCYIQIKKKAYSVPYEFVGKKVWVKVKSKLIEVYYNEAIIKVHTVPKGYRQTDYDDFPDNVKNAVDKDLPYRLQKKAGRISGDNLKQLIRKLLTPHAFINLRRAQGIISVAEKYPASLVEKAAYEALNHRRTPHPKDFKKLIETIKKEEDEHSDNCFILSEETNSFVRNAEYFVHH